MIIVKILDNTFYGYDIMIWFYKKNIYLYIFPNFLESLEFAFQCPNYAILCLQITCQSCDVFDDVCSFIHQGYFVFINDAKGQLFIMLKIDKISIYI